LLNQYKKKKMKRFLSTATFMLFALLNFAQISITVSGNVSNADGTPAEGVTIHISTDSFPTWGGYYNTVQTAADGNYTDTFDVPDNLTQGNVAITMIDCDGNAFTQNSFWSPADMPSADFLYCVQPFCQVAIQVDSTASGTQWGLTAIPSGTAPYSYSWSTGETTAMIVVDEGAEYCVVVTDANGCTATTCIDLGPPPCSVQVEPTPIGALFAAASGEAPFTYAWNTGETTESILPTNTGNYCVTITGNDGCEATDCYYFYSGPDTTCWVSIYEGQNGLLIASASGNAPFMYLWSTGDTTSTINPSGPGTYCVTATDASGCEASNCYTLESNEPDNYSISGFIFPEDSTEFIALQGLVYLYELDPSGMPGANPVDSTPFDLTGVGNFYLFDTVPAGNYIVKAVVDPSTPEAADYFPTYHWSTLWWDQANVITVPYFGNNFFPIVLLETDGLVGPGEIGGFVSDGNGFTGEIDDRSDDPLAGVTVILTDDSDNPLQYAITGEDGTFLFENLPWGTYHVYLEVIGQEHVYTVVTIGPDQPSVTDLHFEVSSDGVTSTVEIIETSSLVLAPNPVVDRTNLVFDLQQASTVEVQLRNVNGQLLQYQRLDLIKGRQNLELDFTGLTPGVYMLNVLAGGQVWTEKLVKAN
jgi:hypothetical protein